MSATSTVPTCCANSRQRWDRPLWSQMIECSLGRRGRRLTPCLSHIQKIRHLQGSAGLLFRGMIERGNSRPFRAAVPTRPDLCASRGRGRFLPHLVIALPAPSCRKGPIFVAKTPAGLLAFSLAFSLAGGRKMTHAERTTSNGKRWGKTRKALWHKGKAPQSL